MTGTPAMSFSPCGVESAWASWLEVARHTHLRASKIERRPKLRSVAKGSDIWVGHSTGARRKS